MLKFIETKSKWWLPEAGVRYWELSFNVYRVSVWDDLKVLESSRRGHDCTSVNVLSATDLYA